MNKLIKTGIFAVGTFMILSTMSLVYHYFIVKDAFEIGFPFSFYLTFKANGNDYSNYGWEKTNLLLDIIIALIFGALFSILGNRKKTA